MRHQPISREAGTTVVPAHSLFPGRAKGAFPRPFRCSVFRAAFRLKFQYSTAQGRSWVRVPPGAPHPDPRKPEWPGKDLVSPEAGRRKRTGRPPSSNEEDRGDTALFHMVHSSPDYPDAGDINTVLPSLTRFSHLLQNFAHHGRDIFIAILERIGFFAPVRHDEKKGIHTCVLGELLPGRNRTSRASLHPIGERRVQRYLFDAFYIFVGSPSNLQNNDAFIGKGKDISATLPEYLMRGKADNRKLLSGLELNLVLSNAIPLRSACRSILE